MMRLRKVRMAALIMVLPTDTPLVWSGRALSISLCKVSGFCGDAARAAMSGILL